MCRKNLPQLQTYETENLFFIIYKNEIENILTELFIIVILFSI